MSAAHAVRRQRSDAGERPFIVVRESTRACPPARPHCRAEAVPDRDPRELDTVAAKDLPAQAAAFGRAAPPFVITGGDPFQRPGLTALIAHGREAGGLVAVSPSGTGTGTDSAPRRPAVRGAAAGARQPLKAKAGERARFRVAAAGSGDGVAFRIVGTVFDAVYQEGAHLLKPGQPSGAPVLKPAAAQGGSVETRFPEGHRAFVDHDTRRGEAGAHGMVEVGE
ncbi:hypothetical protein [Streptomyces sp. NPDC087512]|uniref:hypothetical protein n=1 Tax=unclassified Streptomyces TaxID=2593676 RepID=UPI003439A598